MQVAFVVHKDTIASSKLRAVFVMEDGREYEFEARGVYAVGPAELIAETLRAEFVGTPFMSPREELIGTLPVSD